MKLFLVQVPKQSKRCFIYFFDCTTYYFWSNALYFCFSRFDYLNLVDYVSSSVCKIVTAKESASLFTSFFSRNFSSPTFSRGSWPVFYAFFFSCCWIEKFEFGDNKYPTVSFFNDMFLKIGFI